MTNGTNGVKVDFSKFKSNKRRIIPIIIISAVVILLLATVTTMFYTVSDKEVAVVTTFGKVSGTEEAGIHFKLPFGIQQVTYVAINEIKTIEIGYYTDKNGNSISVDDESMMITGDFNIVNVDFFIEYKISDPVKYLYASNEPENILKMLIQSQIRNVIGSYEIDPILTESKDQIQVDIKALTVTELEEYDIGVSVLSVKIQDCEPPMGDVREAFEAVKNADSGAKTAVNNANAYKNKREAEAKAAEDKITENAEYLKAARINEAHEQVAMFNAMFEEYIKNPGITKTRLYYECIEKVFPGLKIYIDTSENGDMVKVLPLEDLISGNTNTTEGN